MIFSVWNQGAGVFDYYENGARQEQYNVEKPAHLAPRTLGSTVDQAAWPLPSDARPIGSGTDAIGRVAVKKRAGLGGAGDGTTGTLAKVMILGATVLAWKLLSGRPSR